MKKLNFRIDLLNATSHQASLMGILNAYEECNPWIYSNYIQLRCFKDYYIVKKIGLIFYYHNHSNDYAVDEFSRCPWLIYNRMNRSDLLSKWEPYDFIRLCIDRGEYIYVTVNTEYLDAYRGGYFHSLLIYGYDDDKKTVLIADNIEDGRFVEREATKEEIANAFVVPEDIDNYVWNTQGVITVKKLDIENQENASLDSKVGNNYLDQINNVTFKKGKVIQEIKNYLQIDFQGEYLDTPQFIYGNMCYDEIIKDMKDKRDRNGRYDLKALSILIDHKNIMVRRIAYMMEIGLLQQDFDDFSVVHKNIITCRGLAIKYNLTLVPNLLDRCIALLKETKNRESEILRDMINRL